MTRRMRTHGHGTSRVVWTVLAFLAVAAPVMAENLLVNGGFETNGAGWGKFGNADFADWANETGSYGAAFQGWVWNGAGGFFQSVKGAAGQAYTFSIRAMKEQMFQASTVYIKLEFYQQDDATKAGHDQGTINIASTLTAGWQAFTISGKAPLGTAFVRPVIGFDGATTGDLGSGKQACFLDNAELVVTQATPPPE